MLKSDDIVRGMREMRELQKTSTPIKTVILTIKEAGKLDRSLGMLIIGDEEPQFKLKALFAAAQNTLVAIANGDLDG